MLDRTRGGSKKKGKKTATKGKKAKADDSEVAEASGSSLGFDPAVFVDFFADNHPDLPYEMQEDLNGYVRLIVRLGGFQSQRSYKQSYAKDFPFSFDVDTSPSNIGLCAPTLQNPSWEKHNPNELGEAQPKRDLLFSKMANCSEAS